MNFNARDLFAGIFLRCGRLPGPPQQAVKQCAAS
jgi:hypothetical protein